ncbi:hypothetical protein [Hamadaea tsunoensis]|uniref:hypothetical protein n=1 Tax=Hamadaea tsunoensis TaxID=53368 RepID=UPI0003F8AB95|nr:hypothetical protein [Hamadaea tsunoensis]
MIRVAGRGEPPTADDAPAWITGLLPDEWFTGRPDVTIDRDEILIIGTLAEPAHAAEATEADRAVAERGRISGFRETTREQRIRYARQIEHTYQRKVAWGAKAGGTTELFTTLSAPVMTRLRQPERQVLDTLVDAGVARSRSDALAWCVRLVGEHADEWLTQLRSAMGAVDDLRRQGPTL